MDSIAQRLRFLREASGIGPKALALTCKLASTHVHMIETGAIKNPDRTTVQKIADVAGVSAVWLMFGVGESPVAEAVSAKIGAANEARRAAMAAARGRPQADAGDVAQVLPDEDSDNADGDDGDRTEARAILEAARADDTTAHPELAAHPAQDTAAVA